MGLSEEFGKIWPTVQEPDTPDWVEQRIQVNGAPELEGQCLESGNHAVYIGKIVPPSDWQRRARLLLGEESRFAPSETYSPDFIKAALAVLFEHLQPGEKAKFVVGYQLSEYCNGRRSTADAMPYAEEMTLIQQLAAEHFQGDKDNFEVVDLLDEHFQLAKALRECKRNRKTGQIDLDSFFKPEVAKYCADRRNFDSRDAWVFAQLLFAGAKEDPQFLQKLKALPTGELKALRTAPKDDLDPIDAYGLLEIAIRLADAKQGVTFQGGVDRQSKYDALIRQLLAGPKIETSHKDKDGKPVMKTNPWSEKSRSLEALIKLLKGTPFRAFYVDRKKNFYQQQTIQQRARTRFGVLAAAGIATLAGLTQGVTEFAENRSEEAAEAHKEAAVTYFEKHFQDRFCTMYDNWDKRPYKLLASKAFVQIKEELMVRYRFSEEASWQMALQMIEEVIDPKTGNQHYLICESEKNKTVLAQFIDQYIRDHHLAANLGGDELKIPYADMRVYRPLFEETAKHDCDSLELEVHGWPIVGFPNADFIGTYSDPREYFDSFTKRGLYIYHAWDGPVLMATVPTYYEKFHEFEGGCGYETYEQTGDDIKGPYSREERTYCDGYFSLERDGEYLSAEQGCIVAKNFIRDMKSYELNAMPDAQQQLLLDIFRPGTPSHSAHFYGKDAWPDVDPEVWFLEESTLSHFDANGGWQIARYDPDTIENRDVLLAKRPGDSEYSLEAARDLACWKAMNSAHGLMGHSTQEWAWENILNLDLESIAICPERPNSFGKFE